MATPNSRAADVLGSSPHVANSIHCVFPGFCEATLRRLSRAQVVCKSGSLLAMARVSRCRDRTRDQAIHFFLNDNKDKVGEAIVSEYADWPFEDKVCRRRLYLKTARVLFDKLPLETRNEYHDRARRYSADVAAQREAAARGSGVLALQCEKEAEVARGPGDRAMVLDGSDEEEVIVPPSAPAMAPVLEQPLALMLVPVSKPPPAPVLPVSEPPPTPASLQVKRLSALSPRSREKAKRANTKRARGSGDTEVFCTEIMDYLWDMPVTLRRILGDRLAGEALSQAVALSAFAETMKGYSVDVLAKITISVALKKSPSFLSDEAPTLITRLWAAMGSNTTPLAYKLEPRLVQMWGAAMTEGDV